MNDIKQLTEEYGNHHVGIEPMNDVSAENFGVNTMLPLSLVALESMVNQCNALGIKIEIDKAPQQVSTHHIHREYTEEVIQYADLAMIPDALRYELIDKTIKETGKELVDKCSEAGGNVIKVWMLVNKVHEIKETMTTGSPYRIAIEYRVTFMLENTILLPETLENIKANITVTKEGAYASNVFGVQRLKNGKGDSHLVVVTEEAIPDVHIGTVLIIPYAEGFKDPTSVELMMDGDKPKRINDQFGVVLRYIYED